MRPLAPVLFSTRKVAPLSTDMRCATTRVTMSVTPPAANGTRILTGLAGYCAAAICAAAQSIRAKRPRMLFLPRALERVKGIEPSYAAWEAAVLPLNYTRERKNARENCIIHLMIQIIVNGSTRRHEAPLPLSELIDELALKGKKIAVERNGEIVPKSAHASTLLADGDRLEIVAAVGGG